MTANADVTVPLHLSARAIEAPRERGFLTVDRPTVWGIEASRHGDARRSLEGRCPGGRSSVIATARGRSRGLCGGAPISSVLLGPPRDLVTRWTPQLYSTKAAKHIAGKNRVRLF